MNGRIRQRGRMVQSEIQMKKWKDGMRVDQVNEWNKNDEEESGGMKGGTKWKRASCTVKKNI